RVLLPFPILLNCCVRRCKARQRRISSCCAVALSISTCRSWARSRIVFPPCLVLLHIKFNQVILNRRYQGASFPCQHAGPPRKGRLNPNTRAAEPVPGLEDCVNSRRNYTAPAIGSMRLGSLFLTPTRALTGQQITSSEG